MLIKAKNKTRETTVSEVAITDTLIEFLDKPGFSLETVLEQGRAIDLSEKIGISYGGNSEEIFDRTHPQIISTLERAAAVVHGEVIGFDFIIQDPTKDPSGQKWGIIECNSLPFINLHHFPLHGTPINVAGKIWDLWEK